MRFHKTTNVSYQCVYSSETENEYTDMYSMLPEINDMAEQITYLKEQIEDADKDFWRLKKLFDKQALQIEILEKSNEFYTTKLWGKLARDTKKQLKELREGSEK